MLHNYIRSNPSNACVIPKAIKGHKYENMFLIALFTGMRQCEVCGLRWECVDFDNGTILIDKQLQKGVEDIEKYALIPTKNGKERTITAAPCDMDLLWQVKKGSAYRMQAFIKSVSR